MAVGIALIVLLSGDAFAHPPSVPAAHGAGIGSDLRGGAGPFSPAAPAPINTTLTVNHSSVNLSSDFWGTTVNNEVRMFRGESNAVNATPARVLVWPGAMAGEDYDPLANIHYDTYSGSPKHALTSEAQFVQMCKATHCRAIVQVPAEIDNAAYAAKIVNYTEVNLSFQPAYWMIGNEPELWYHWKLPWKSWASQYSTGPTPTQFGNEVVAYVKAIRAIDNTTPILGLPASGCTCGYWTFSQWISGVLNVTGPIIQAVAFHEYPAGWLGTGDGSLHDFYGTIQSAAGIPTRMIAARQAVQSACAGCNVSVLISELGAALSWSAYGQYSIGFSGSLSLASQLTQSMDFNLTNVDLFATELNTTNSWFDPTGHARADYTLYTGILDHLGTQSHSVRLPGMDRTLYGIATVAPNDQRRQDLMVVNDNITHSIAFTPRFAEFTVGAPVEAWSWNGSIHDTTSNATTWVEPYTANPVPETFSGGLPGTYLLPPQSMVLFESYPSGGTYVQVRESGVPAPAPWYASVGSTFYTTTASNFSILLPTNSYPVASVPVPLPINGDEVVPAEQLGPFVASPAQVSGAYTNITVDFVPQWRVNVTASPGVGGTVTPAVTWWNQSEPLTLTSAPAKGYAFAGWSGWGPGSTNGSGRVITLLPTGRIFEKARFVAGNEVDLAEYGLPAGTPWSVTVRGFTTSSSTTVLPVYEPPGVWGFTVTPVPGYRSLPHNGSFNSTSAWSFSKVRFVPVSPPSPTYPVAFHLSGLPGTTPVSVTVRDLTLPTGFLSPPFQLINGSYAYQPSYVAGFHPDVPTKTFVVAGGPLVIDVPFVPTMYPVTWVVSGTRPGMNWSVQLNGQPIAANSAWVSVDLTNGSYPYVIELPQNFSASPRTGMLEVGGAGITLSLVFQLVVFPTGFSATGPGADSGWWVRLGNLTRVASAGLSTFQVANGTYSFDVHPPAGEYAVPSHGNVSIAGPNPPLLIQFHPSSLRPSAALVAALSSGAVSVSLWIGAAVFGAFGTFRLLRRRDG